MKKIFITGGSGLLGSNIIKLASEKYTIYGSYNKHKICFHNIPLLHIDIMNKKQLNVIVKIKPDCIIHCAAIVNIDECEKNPEFAYQQNVQGTENIVEVAEAVDSFLIYISTDAVFDGKKGNYSEEDSPNPINVYGETKLKAEQIVQKSSCKSCIVRTNIYGWNKLEKLSLAEWMIYQLENNKVLYGFIDVQFTPILVNNLSEMLFEIYEKKIQGILNVAGLESCSKFEFAKKIANVFQLNKNLIKPVSIDTVDLIAIRGKNLSLNTKKIQSLLKTPLYNVEEGLCEMKKLRDIGYLSELKKT
jgi:dTDP-4-dehydrorhamnose reductase